MDSTARPVGGGFILLVEKDADLRGALQFAFETQGYRVRAFADAESVLQSERPERFCLVIDHSLPGLSWGKLVERLGGAVPVVLIASHPTGETQRLVQTRNVVLVEKPLLGDDLNVAVARAMAQF